MSPEIPAIRAVRRPARPAPALAAVETPKILEADLRVTLRDADGFGDRSGADVRGRVAGTVRIGRGYVLARLREAIRSDAGKSIDAIRWDAGQRAYVVKGRVKLAWLPDPAFTITLRPTADGRLQIEARSWADWLARLLGRKDSAATLREQLAALDGRIAVSEEGGKFLLDLLPGMKVPFGAMGGELTISEIRGRAGDRALDIDGHGGLLLRIKHAEIAGGTRLGTPTRPDAQADEAELDVKLALHENRQVEATIRGRVRAHLDGDELAAMVGTHKDVLGPIGRAATVEVGDLLIDGHYAAATDWQTRASGRVDVLTESGLSIAGPLTALIDGEKHVTRVEARGLRIAHPGVAEVVLPRVRTEKTPAGFDFQLERGPEAPYAPRPATTGNRLGLVIGGAAFARTLHDMLERARDHVHGETFEFSPGEHTRALIAHMAERAAGIRTADGRAVFAGDGVPVRVITDREPHDARSWAGRSADALAGRPGEAWAAELRAAIAEGRGKYAGLTTAQREAALASLARNLEIRDNAHPVLRTDHRKVWVVDGVFGMTGGMNLDDPMLTTLHDVMVPTVGPAVRDLQAEWLENWQELGSAATGRALLPDDAAIARDGARFGHLVGAPRSEVQVLVTDDRQNEIEEALVRAIDGATTRIRLEHAYFTHDRVIERLGAALARGVALDVIVPEAPWGVFEVGNRQKLMQLVEAASRPGAGKLEVTFFQQGHDYFFHNHTKALAVDGRELIVGSGNLDQRGMAGSFASDGARLLFNRELDFRITDPAYVARFEREVFDADKAPGEGKPLAAEVAEDWAFPALRAEKAYFARFHKGVAADEVIGALGQELACGAAGALADARRRTGSPAAGDGEAVAALLGRVDVLRRRLGVLEAPLVAGEVDARRLDAEAAAILATLPEGRVRDHARKTLGQARDAYRNAVENGPGNPVWFARQLLATYARFGLRGATLPLRDRLAGVIAGAPSATFDAEYRRVLVPDPRQARYSEALDFLF